MLHAEIFSGFEKTFSCDVDLEPWKLHYVLVAVFLMRQSIHARRCGSAEACLPHFERSSVSINSRLLCNFPLTSSTYFAIEYQF